VTLDRDRLLCLSRKVLDQEEKGLRALRRVVEKEPFAETVEMLVACRGRIIVCGVGKSGIVGQRIASSFRSTGAPSIFLHPVEAMHGDLGLVDPADIGLFLSKSGESAELLHLLPTFKRIPVPLAVIVGNGASQLGRSAEACIELGPMEEAGPLALVPTTTLTAFQVMGDLLVTALYVARGVTEADLAWLHPGGVIGRKVTLRVSEIMHRGDGLPCVRETASLREAIMEMMEKKLGMTTVVDSEGRLSGILTDGDLRRAVHTHDRIDPLSVAEVMTRNPRTVHGDALLAAAVERMENNPGGPITTLVVPDEDGRPEGVIHLHDCLRIPGGK